MNLTEEQQADVQAREKDFIEAYTKLTEQFQIDFISFPMFVPSSQGIFSVMVNSQLRDKKYLEPLSPIQNIIPPTSSPV